MENSNKKYKISDLIIHKVKEPAEVYVSEKTFENIEEHPLFIKVIEKSKQDLREGKGIPHDVVMKNIKEKYPFLK